jgi:hypothetical protein
MTEREPEELDEAEVQHHDPVSDATTPHPRSRLDADYLLDRVIPDEIDWRGLVRRHPLLAVGAAAGLGFLLGRARGAAIIAGTSAAVTTAVMRQLTDVFEGEVFEF